MGKLLILTLIAVWAMGCRQTNTYTINGSVADSSISNTTVYLFDDDNNVIDSCLIVDGKFTFKGDIDSLVTLQVNLTYGGSAVVVAEAGVIDIKLGGQDEPDDISGTPLNDLLDVYSKEMHKLSKDVISRYTEILNDRTISDQQKSAKLSELSEKYISDRNAVSNPLLEQNKNNSLGLYVLCRIVDDVLCSILNDVKTLQQMDSTINIIGERAMNYPPIKMAREAKEHAERTTAGKMFLDFDGQSPSGAATKLSDYVGKGNYVLADFWASWCGPCRAAVPHLKEIYKEYKKKGLVVVGVNVRDSKEDFDAAMTELDMPWAQICVFDSNTPTDLYCIKRIPTMILFAPDGTIVSRGHELENIRIIQPDYS